MEIKQAKVRGVESNGMLCSARELGIADDAAGLLILAADAPIGVDVRQYLELDDQLFTIKPTPNRGDCLSVFGVAREVAAITGGVVKPVYRDGRRKPCRIELKSRSRTRPHARCIAVAYCGE